MGFLHDQHFESDETLWPCLPLNQLFMGLESIPSQELYPTSVPNGNGEHRRVRRDNFRSSYSLLVTSCWTVINPSFSNKPVSLIYVLRFSLNRRVIHRLSSSLSAQSCAFNFFRWLIVYPSSPLLTFALSTRSIFHNGVTNFTKISTGQLC